MHGIGVSPAVVVVVVGAAGTSGVSPAVVVVGGVAGTSGISAAVDVLIFDAAG
jgi:hypothetical protein